MPSISSLYYESLELAGLIWRYKDKNWGKFVERWAWMMEGHDISYGIHGGDEILFFRAMVTSSSEVREIGG